MRFFTLLLLMCLPFQRVNGENPPSGTLVFSGSNGFIGRQAERVTGDLYTHVGIVLDGKIYEAVPPAVTRSNWPPKVSSVAFADVYYPVKQYSGAQAQVMTAYAGSQLGVPYRLYNYFHPNGPRINGTWCSRFAGDVLVTSGRYVLTEQQKSEPENLRLSLPGYVFKYRIQGVEYERRFNHGGRPPSPR